MTNPVHLLITPVRNEALSSIMHSVGRCDVRYRNRKRGHGGALWEGRYRAGMVQTERCLLTCYLELFRYELDPGVIDALCHATNHKLWVGTSRFKDAIGAMTKRRVRPGRPKKVEIVLCPGFPDPAFWPGVGERSLSCED